MYECVCLGICSTLNVVAPTVPERLANGSADHASRQLHADHKMPRVVRRQAVGSLGTDTGQTVRMGLRATGCPSFSVKTDDI